MLLCDEATPPNNDQPAGPRVRGVGTSRTGLLRRERHTDWLLAMTSRVVGRLRLPPCNDDIGGLGERRTMYDMETTLTVRVPKEQSEALTRLARSRKVTVSVLVRGLLDQSLSGRRLKGFAALAGSVASSAASASSFRTTIRGRNFRE